MRTTCSESTSSSRPSRLPGSRASSRSRAPFRVAVTAVAARDDAMAGLRGEGEALPLSVSLDELQQLLVADLRALNAATHVFAVAGEDMTAAVRAAEGRADLVLRNQRTAWGYGRGWGWAEG